MTSSVMLHETSAMRRIFAESRRLLRPGGLMVHLETAGRHEHLGLWEQMRTDFEAHYNNEPFLAAFSRTDFAEVAYAIQGASLVLLPITGALSIIALQDLLPDDMRGKGMALSTLVRSLVGASLGPTLVALATQHLFHDPAKVGYSIALVLAPAMLAAAASFLAVRNSWTAAARASR